MAQSDDVIVLEGTAYFPVADVRDGSLRPVWFKTLCYWKGIASYYDVRGGGDVVAKKSAWTYRHPSPLARSIKGRIAFWHDIDVRIERPDA